MSEIVIKPDQMAVAKGEAVLITMALGSSLAVCMYDEEGGIGGLVHTLLPDIRREGNGKNGLRYVDTATRALFEAMKEAGAVPERIRVKLVGGAKIFCFAGQSRFRNSFSLSDRRGSRISAGRMSAARERCCRNWTWRLSRRTQGKIMDGAFTLWPAAEGLRLKR